MALSSPKVTTISANSNSTRADESTPLPNQSNSTFLASLILFLLTRYLLGDSGAKYIVKVVSKETNLGVTMVFCKIKYFHNVSEYNQTFICLKNCQRVLFSSTALVVSYNERALYESRIHGDASPRSGMLSMEHLIHRNVLLGGESLLISLILQSQKRYNCQVSSKLHGAGFGDHVCIYTTIPIWML
jgi:hypothetical protein